MRKSEIFSLITDIVVNETEIERHRVFSKERYADVVDARCMVVYCCHLAGLYVSDISGMTGISKRTVERIISGFDDRRKYNHPLFSMQYEIITTKLRQAIGTTH